MLLLLTGILVERKFKKMALFIMVIFLPILFGLIILIFQPFILLEEHIFGGMIMIYDILLAGYFLYFWKRVSKLETTFFYTAGSILVIYFIAGFISIFSNTDFFENQIFIPHFFLFLVVVAFCFIFPVFNVHQLKLNSFVKVKVIYDQFETSTNVRYGATKKEVIKQCFKLIPEYGFGMNLSKDDFHFVLKTVNKNVSNFIHESIDIEDSLSLIITKKFNSLTS